MKTLKSADEISIQKIFVDVRNVISKSLQTELDVISMDSTIDELGINSLDILEISFGIEDIYDVDIVGNDIIEMHSVKDIVSIIKSSYNK